MVFSAGKFKSNYVEPRDGGRCSDRVGARNSLMASRGAPGGCATPPSYWLYLSSLEASSEWGGLQESAADLRPVGCSTAHMSRDPLTRWRGCVHAPSGSSDGRAAWHNPGSLVRDGAGTVAPGGEPGVDPSSFPVDQKRC